VSALVLAQEALPKGVWNPTILGVLVVVSAIVLFVGSTYLLLGTNLGGRLGFWVTAAAFTGMMTMLATLWLTTSTPLNSPHGRPARWIAVEVAKTAADAKTSAVHQTQQPAHRQDPSVIPVIQPSVVAALVPQTDIATGGTITGPLTIPGTSSQNDIIIKSVYQSGGRSQWLFRHEPLYKVVQFCQDDQSDNPPAGSVEPVPPPKCDTAIGDKVIVLRYDYGSMRLTPLMYLLGFGTLFVLCLLVLHWRERDLRADRAPTAPTPATTEG
jgi:hypothetical protein